MKMDLQRKHLKLIAIRYAQLITWVADLNLIIVKITRRSLFHLRLMLEKENFHLPNVRLASLQEKKLFASNVKLRDVGSDRFHSIRRTVLLIFCSTIFDRRLHSMVELTIAITNSNETNSSPDHSIHVWIAFAWDVEHQLIKFMVK